MKYSWSNLIGLLRTPYNNKINSNRGFTLLETLVTMGLTVVIGLFMIKGLSFFDKSKDELSSHISSAGSLLHAQRVIMSDLSSNGFSFNASGASFTSKTHGPARDFFSYGVGKDEEKSFTLKKGGTFNFVTSVAFAGNARKFHAPESSLCQTSTSNRCLNLKHSLIRTLFGDLWAKADFFIIQAVVPDEYGAYPSFLAMRNGDSLEALPTQYKFWRNWRGHKRIEEFIRDVPFYGSEPNYRVEPVQVVQYFIDNEKNLLRHVFLPSEIGDASFKPDMRNSTYLLAVSEKFDLQFKRKSIFSMQISIDFPAFLVAYNRKLELERKNADRFFFIKELRADAIDGGVFGNVAASRVVTLVQAGVHGFVPSPVPFVRGELTLDLYCITHNFRSRWDLRNYGVNRYDSSPVKITFAMPTKAGRQNTARTEKLEFATNSVANGLVRGKRIPTKGDDLLNIVINKKVYLTSATQGNTQLVWYNSGGYGNTNSWGWGAVNGNHNGLKVDCQSRPQDNGKGTESFSCQTHIVFLPAYSGFRGSCGGFKSPLMLFFGERAPGFGATSMFKLDEDDLMHSWPEEGNDAYFIVVDKNNNGKIDDYREIFATDPNSNAFEKLAEYDINKDGLITSEDSSWKVLTLWNDKNANSKVDSGEMRTMDELGVKSISVRYDNVDVSFGPLAKADTVSEFKYVKDGKILKGECYDVYFKAK